MVLIFFGIKQKRILIDRCLHQKFQKKNWTGFGDPRGVEYEVLVSHLLKKLTGSEKSVKILFAASEDYFGGVVFGPFWDFASRMTNLMNNRSNYRDSIGIVITKAGRRLNNDGNWKVRSDEEIINKAIQGLNNIENIINSYFGKYNPNTPKFIDILLEKIGGKYKVDVFPKPNIKIDFEGEAPTGLVSVLKVPSLQRAKEAIKSMIEQLKFIHADPTDFGYAVCYARLSPYIVIYITIWWNPLIFENQFSYSFFTLKRFIFENFSHYLKKNLKKLEHS